MGLARDVTRGLVAGAAGTVALNTLTYLDMAVRGRPASRAPAQMVEETAERAGVGLASHGDEQAAENRSEGLGALLGYASGLGFGALYGVASRRVGELPVPAGAAALTVAAMAGANIPSVAVGVTDPHDWPAQAWVADIVPHLGYGLVTAAVFEWTA